MNYLLKLYKKNKEIINYIIVGVLTTLVSIGSYAVLRLIIDYYLIASILSWICAVTFAYVTNRIFVFESKDKNIILEFNKFVFSRLLTLLIETSTMYLLVSIIHLNDMFSKILVQFIIIVLNYIFSKLFVFSKNEKK